MFPNLGMGELVIILIIILLLFGAKKLPEVARGLGRSLKAFKDGLSDSGEPPSDRKSDSNGDQSGRPS